MQGAAEALEIFGIESEFHVVSAHRTPHDVAQFGEKAAAKGYRVLIAGAGGAAHLPGMLASYTPLPVIGVPVALKGDGALEGKDALYSIVQMPKGIPVATVAIGNSFNAGLLAAQIIASGSRPELLSKISAYKNKLARESRASRKK